MFENLDDENFMLFAAKYYENAHCTDLLEFHDDLKRIRYVKRLFKKYEQSGELKDRLIFNHLIVLYNTFEHRAMTRMLCFKLDDQLKYLKPFLMYLNYWRTDIGLIDGKKINDSDIALDAGIVKLLREIDGN
tara:strand:+ start:1004 stop:1399 length:396 start_codon:yes stop_codon:yes gene_type:complete